MTLTDVGVGIAILVGLTGIIVPVIPGTLLIWAAVLAWSLEIQNATGWTVLAVVTALLTIGTIVKYLLPGRRLKATVPTRTLWIGALFAIAGFFMIPVVGIFIGFPVGVYVAERVRLGADQAWPSTRAALKAMGASILIELIFGVLATIAWGIGVFLVR